MAIEQVVVTTVRGGRNRYLDTLRAVALIRVVTYHATDSGWLSIVFPSMGVMFALAGSLMAGSLDRRPPWTVMRQRLRRLLLPFWLFAAVVVVSMLRRGWPDWRPDRLASGCFRSGRRGARVGRRPDGGCAVPEPASTTSIAGLGSATREQIMETTHKLYRSKSNRKLAGVCGGLGEYLGADPTIVRVLFIVLAVFGGAGLIIYLAMWLIVPQQP